MLTKEQAKEEIQKLISNFDNVVNNNQTKDYNEEDVKNGFIIPFFDKLNWTSSDISQIKSESKVLHRKRVDYAFKISGVTKFLVEAKSFEEDIDEDKSIEQAYNYGYNIGIRWVLLTNFKRSILIDCFVKYKEQSKSLILNYYDYSKRIDDLWMFNKEGFLKPKNDLEEWADKYRPLLKRKEVAELIFDELIDWRTKLTNNINSHPIKNKLDKEELDEAVQTILDRLIFIRTCEDRGFENPQLKPILNKWEDNNNKKIIDYLNDLFRDFDGRYNSELFTPPKYTDLFIDNFILEKLIKGLYFNSDNTAIFDFSLIDVDVLGNIYEEYLEYLLKVGKKSTLKKKHQHRKDFGQFYTPTYIVDYIIKNTVLKALENNNSLKILDCACGSGSFLIKAFDKLQVYYKENNVQISDEKILKNSIYGVDIDKKACEIANLNLIFKILKQQQRLPKLNDNIKCGNSLISGKKEELEKYFNDVEEKKPFNWEEEFRDIFKEGKFDVVIGNPPYVFTRGKHFDRGEKDYINEHYLKGMESISKSHARQSGKINLFSVFLIRGINLLNNEGLLGFIVPNNLLRTTTYDIIRKFLLDNCKILQIVDLSSGVFEGVTASTIIIILQKESNKTKRDINKVEILTNIKDLTSGHYDTHHITQKDFHNNTSYAFDIFISGENKEILEKICKSTIKLGEICIIHAGGIATGQNKKEMIQNYKKNSKYKPMLEGKDIKPYYPEFKNRYILYDRKLLYRARKESIFLSPEKLVTQRIGGGKHTLVVSYDNQQYYTFNSTNTILHKNKKYSLKYILALLNSDLINFYYINKFSNKSDLTVNISKTFLEQLPIKDISKEKQSRIIELVDKILNFSKELTKEKNKFSTKYLKLKEEIEKIDKEINYLVYDLYSISKEEKEIIKKSL